jgi:hypothetical protein
MTAIETCYISTGCNRTPHCADWGCSGLICFGACRSVSIYQPEVWFYPAIPVYSRWNLYILGAILCFVSSSTKKLVKRGKSQRNYALVYVTIFFYWTITYLWCQIQLIIPSRHFRSIECRHFDLFWKYVTWSLFPRIMWYSLFHTNCSIGIQLSMLCSTAELV